MNHQFEQNAQFADLPGSEFIWEGLADLESGRESVASLLIEIGRTRLSRAGVRLPVPTTPKSSTDAETRLYRLLGRTQPENAYSQYNAWIRRLVSLEQALESRYERSAVRRLSKDLR